MAQSKVHPTDTRERILNAALDLFSDLGFHGTTTRKIAQKAGVNEVTIFRQFKTKENLFQAVLDNVKNVGFDLGTVDFNIEDIEPYDLLTFMVDYVFDLFAKYPRELRLLIMSLFEGVEGFEEEYVARNRNEGLKVISRAFRTLQEQKRISSPLDPDILAQLMLGQVVEMATQMSLVKMSPIKNYDSATVCDSIKKLFLS